MKKRDSLVKVPKIGRLQAPAFKVSLAQLEVRTFGVDVSNYLLTVHSRARPPGVAFGRTDGRRRQEPESRSHAARSRAVIRSGSKLR